MIEETLILDCEARLQDYRTYWFDLFRRELPNAVIFWGVLVTGALFLSFLSRDFASGFYIFLFLAAAVFLFPLLTSAWNYQSYMKMCSNYISGMPADEKNFNLIFKPDSEGFECVSGKNFSFIAWESIAGVQERNDYFVLTYKNQPILINKKDFRQKADLYNFRLILEQNLGGKVRFLAEKI